MSSVQVTIPFKPRKKVYVADEDDVSNENKNTLNIKKSSRILKRHVDDDLKKCVDDGEDCFFFCKYFQ